MDITYLIDDNYKLDSFYISEYDKNLSIEINEETFYYLLNYLYERILFNYLLIIFFFSCGTTIFICNYNTKKKKGYKLIHNQDHSLVKGEIIQKV